MSAGTFAVAGIGTKQIRAQKIWDKKFLFSCLGIFQNDLRKQESRAMIRNHIENGNEQEKYAARKRTESRGSWKPAGDARRKFACEPLAERVKTQ